MGNKSAGFPHARPSYVNWSRCSRRLLYCLRCRSSESLGLLPRRWRRRQETDLLRGSAFSPVLFFHSTRYPKGRLPHHHPPPRLRPPSMDLIVRQVLFALMASIVLCEPPLSNQYGVPGNFAGGHHGAQGGGNGFGGHYGGHDNQDYTDNEPKAYEFGYSVKDHATGNDFGRQETSDGETVRGEYRVQLPDGRTQIVTYTADWRTGFHADVRYEGTATYPDQYNTGYNQGGQGVGYQGNQIGGGFTGGNQQGGFNYPQGGGHYNNANNYQFGSNSIDSSYNNFGSRNYPGAPSPTYGPAFH